MSRDIAGFRFQPIVLFPLVATLWLLAGGCQSAPQPKWTAADFAGPGAAQSTAQVEASQIKSVQNNAHLTKVMKKSIIEQIKAEYKVGGGKANVGLRQGSKSHER